MMRGAKFVFTGCLVLASVLSLASAGTLNLFVGSGRVEDRDGWGRGDSDPELFVSIFPTVPGLYSFGERENDDSPTWNKNYNWGGRTDIPSFATINILVRDIDSGWFGIDGLFSGSDDLGSGTVSVSPSRSVRVPLRGSNHYVDIRVTYTPTNLCLRNNGDCGSNSRCSSIGDNQRFCSCNSGYKSSDGRNCAPINNCQQNPCPSNSDCVYTGPATHKCDCLSGYRPVSGRCDRIYPCRENSNLCGANSVCTDNGPGLHTCTCRPNYSSKTGANCEPIDPCATNNGGCGQNSACEYVRPGVSKCACDAGHAQGDGADCFPINPCKEQPGICGSNSVCEFTGPDAYACACKAGHRSANGDNKNCVAINPCVDDPTICGANSLCDYTAPGEHKCNCRNGYSSANGANCVEIDNCVTNNGGCGDNSLCTFSGPGTNDCSCLSGYTSDSGTARDCRPINLCQDFAEYCGKKSICTYRGPNDATCACETNYESNTGRDCVAIDPCAKNPQICGDNSICTPTGPGAHSCSCVPKYESAAGDGSNCSPIDPCSSGTNGDCGPNAQCTFAGPAERTCACNAGFFGDPEAGQATYCAKITTCAGGEYQTKTPTVTSDRTCSKCQSGYACPGGTEPMMPCGKPTLWSGAGFAVCKPVQTGYYGIGGDKVTMHSAEKQCEIGYYCNEGIRAKCPQGLYADQPGVAACAQCTVCRRGETEQRSCTAEQNAVCEDTTPPKFTLSGCVDCELEAGVDAWKEPGYTCTDTLDGDITARVRVTGKPDVTKLGKYTVSYKCTDAAGLSTEVSRTVVVADTLGPVIELKGDGEIDVEAKLEKYQDQGAIAIDAFDGEKDVTASEDSLTRLYNAVSGGNVGTYVLTYSATDAEGNKATSIQRIVHVVDTTVPVIKLNGVSPLVIKALPARDNPETYEDAGATAHDAVDGDLTQYIQVDASRVDVTKLGDYKVTFNVQVPGGGQRAREVVRLVRVRDKVPPVLTLKGKGSVTVEAATTWSDPGWTVEDNFDSGATLAKTVEIEGTVETNAPDKTEYVLTYTVSDTSGNNAEARERTVTVRDRTPPVITMRGDPELILEASTVYKDAGATAFDTLDGDVVVKTDNPVSSFPTETPTTYSVTYTAQDNAGNPAVPVTRTVTVLDRIAPVITMGKCPGQANAAKNASAFDCVVEAASFFEDPGFTATDSYDQPRQITTDTTGSVNIFPEAVPVTFELGYSAVDRAGNPTKASRTVTVVDTTAPSIVLMGAQNIELQGGQPWVEPGYKAADSYWGNLTDAVEMTVQIAREIDNGGGGQGGDISVSLSYDAVEGIDDHAPAGTQFRIVYEVRDGSGNVGTMYRTIIIIDTLRPVFPKDSLPPPEIEAFRPRVEWAYKPVVEDQLDGDLSDNVMLVVSAHVPAEAEEGDDGDRRRRRDLLPDTIANISSVDTSAPLGTVYTVTMSVQDAAGNEALLVSNMTLVDTMAPKIVVMAPPTGMRARLYDGEEGGSSTLEVAADETFVSPGATALDNYDGDISSKVVTTGADGVTTDVIGREFVVTYTARDSSGNTGLHRCTVLVVDPAALAAATNGGGAGGALEPGSTGYYVVIIVGALVGVALVALLVVMILRRRNGGGGARGSVKNADLSVAGFENPSAFVYSNPMFNEPVSVDDWYHGAIPRDEAEQRLKANGMDAGLFLVRCERSTSNGEEVFEICLVSAGAVYHAPVSRGADGIFMVDGAPCESSWGRYLLDVIEKLRVQPHSLPRSLGRPCPPPLSAVNVTYVKSGSDFAGSDLYSSPRGSMVGDTDNGVITNPTYATADGYSQQIPNMAGYGGDGSSSNAPIYATAGAFAAAGSGGRDYDMGPTGSTSNPMYGMLDVARSVNPIYETSSHATSSISAAEEDKFYLNVLGDPTNVPANVPLFMRLITGDSTTFVPVDRSQQMPLGVPLYKRVTKTGRVYTMDSNMMSMNNGYQGEMESGGGGDGGDGPVYDRPDMYMRVVGSHSDTPSYLRVSSDYEMANSELGQYMHVKTNIGGGQGYDASMGHGSSNTTHYQDFVPLNDAIRSDPEAYMVLAPNSAEA
eukprot:UC1_evm1s857